MVQQSLFRFALFISAFLVSQCVLADAALTERLIKIIEKDMPHANVGFMFIEADTGHHISKYRAEHSFHPASNAKAFVSAAALFYFDEAFHYKTTLAATPESLNRHVIHGDVIIKFTGDPSLRREDIDALFASLTEKGVRAIKGNILIDDTEFTGALHPDGYSLDDLAWYYAAPVSAIIIDGNQATVKITPAQNIDEIITASGTERDHWLSVQADAKTVSAEYAHHHCKLKVKMDHNNAVNLQGCWPINRLVTEKSLAIENPLLRAQEVIDTALKAQKISFNGQIKRGMLPAHHDILAQHHSKTLSELVTHLMKESDNLYADAIFKTIGKHINDNGSFISGIHAVREILVKNTDIDMQQVKIADGSGSRYNLMSPRAISQLLYSVHHSKKIQHSFRRTLPIAKVDGTLAWRFKDQTIPGQILAKTGSMHDISALSGYMINLKGKPYIFSIVTNQVIGDIRKAKRLEEKLLLTMLEAVN